MDLVDALHISAAGMRVQGVRLRVIAENLANADSLGTVAGAEPYRRKVVSFRTALERSLGIRTVQVDRIGTDRGAFETRFDPSNPAADASGYVMLPNVNPLIEMTDMREAERSYEANLKVIEASRTMLQKTVDLLR